MATSTDLSFVITQPGATLATGGVLTVNGTINFVTATSLKLQGTAVSANASEINSLTGISTSFPTLLPGAPTFTIGAEAGDVINVLCSLNDSKGNAIAANKVVYVYLSDSATGDGLIGTAPSGGTAIGTDGTLLEAHTATKSWMVWTEADGDFDINITEAGAKTLYVCVVIGGNLYVSSAVTFA